MLRSAVRCISKHAHTGTIRWGPLRAQVMRRCLFAVALFRLGGFANFAVPT
jgi:hypothetical protein